MLVKAEMVPLAVSAHGKFDEAAHFFNKMIEAQTNVREFPHNLSAFLSALRSVTFYLQEQFGKDAKFAEWYEKRQQEMRDDALLRMLKEFRDEALHARPVELKFTYGPRLPREGVETDHLEWSVETEESGKLRIRLKVGREGEEEEVAAQVRWLADLDGKEVEVLVACESGLKKIHSLLHEWQGIVEGNRERKRS